MTETVRDIMNRTFREFRRYDGDGQGGTGALPIGDPASGTHSPPKSEIREGFGAAGDLIDQAVDDAELARDEAQDAQAAAESAAGANLSNADSRAAAIETNIPAPVNYIRTAGYADAGDGGGALYKRVASEPSHAGKFQSADGAWWEIAETALNAEMFGAVGNGTTNDASASQGMLGSAAAIGAHVRLRRRTYRLDSPIQLSSGLIFDLNGATLDFTNADAAGVTRYIFADGTASAAFPLAANSGPGSVAGKRTITLLGTNMTALNPQPGDMLRLWSSTQFDPARTQTWKGEIVFVASVSGDNITTTTDIQDLYLTTATASVEKITPVRNIEIRGPGRIIGAPAAEGTDRGIEFYRAVACKVVNVDFSEIDLAHVRFRDCVDCHAVGNTFRRTRPTTQGYGISFVDATQDCSAVHNFFEGCRHSLSTNNSADYGGVVRRILFESNFVLDSAPALGGSMAGGDAIDTHAAADEIIIRNNVCIGATGQGINVECSSAVVEGNYIEGGAVRGIFFRNETPKPGTARIAHNTVKRCGTATDQRAIMVGAGISQTNNVMFAVQVIGNIVEDCAGAGIEVAGPASAPWANVAVTGNTVRGCEGTAGQVRLTNIDLFSFVGNTIVDQISVAASLRLTAVRRGTVSANTLRAKTTGPTSNAIWVDGVCTRLAITGNTIHVDNAATNRRGVIFGDDVTHSGVWNNNIENATAGVTLGSGTGNVQANNITA